MFYKWVRFSRPKIANRHFRKMTTWKFSHFCNFTHFCHFFQFWHFDGFWPLLGFWRLLRFSYQTLKLRQPKWVLCTFKKYRSSPIMTTFTNSDQFCTKTPIFPKNAKNAKNGKMAKNEKKSKKLRPNVQFIIHQVCVSVLGFFWPLFGPLFGPPFGHPSQIQCSTRVYLVKKW